jgi:hypothetical protein
MKVLLAFAAIFLVAVTSTPCYYTSTDGLFYDLENIGNFNNNWISANDSNGNVWSIKVCQPDFVEDLNPLCPVNSSICVSSNGVISNRGSSSSAIYADSPFGSSQGVEVVFGTDGVCPDDNASSVKTIVEFVCQQDTEDSVDINDYYITVDSDNCFTTISIYSVSACPTTVGMDDDMDGYESETIMIAPFMTFFGLVLMALVFSCMCCCCMIRRRRTQKKEIAMKQFSNLAFQPIPASNQFNQPQVMRQNPNFPAYNPYVQQPQFLYYYPTQQQQVQVQQQQPQMVELDQLNGDEKLAKELQAQFDREHQV